MEKSSSPVERSSKGQRQMTDTAFASELVQDAFPIRPGRNVKAAIGAAFDALKRRERQLPTDVLRERPRQWTERRVRSLWFREAKRVDHYEIEDLTAVAVQEARIERQRLKAREERLTALIAAAHQGRMGTITSETGGPVRGMDMSGVEPFPAEDTDQSISW